MLRQNFVLLSGFIFLIGCGRPGPLNSEVKETKVIAVEETQSLDLTLSNLDAELKKQGLSPLHYSAKKEILETDTPLPIQKTNIKISLGKLTQAQCEAAKSVYASGWKSQLSGVDCSDKREFLLEDFLTPVMQATLRHTFTHEVEESSRDLTPEEREKYGIIRGGQYVSRKVLATNCWSTLYEVLRRETHPNATYSVHNFNQSDVDEILKAPEYSRSRIGPAKPSDTENALKKWGVVFGDYLIVRDVVNEYTGEIGIVHAATFIDQGLLFERVGTDSKYPMRIGSFSDIVEQYPRGSYEVRRLLKDLPPVQQTSLPTTTVEAGEGFVYETTFLVRDIKLQRQSNGRMALP